MAARKKAARQRRIINELNFQPTLRIADLAERLNVSSETIRRDLDDLTRQGLISRTYGGAVRRASPEVGLNERHNLLVQERQTIAQLAVPLLTGAKHIMVGSGATTVHVARRLATDVNNTTVIAHSFGVATVLSLNPTIDVLMAPGRYQAEEGALQGSQTLSFLENLRADWAVLGASGLTKEGVADAMIESAEVYAAMSRRAAQTMVVADNSKFHKISHARYAIWDKIDVLVTDQQPSGDLARAVRASGTRVLTGPVSVLPS